MSGSPEAGSFELELFSPARVNLFLRVQPRADGLHDVARLSQAVDLGDRLQLARIPNSPSQAAGVVRPSRKTDPIKQHVEFSATPVGLPGLPTGLLREGPLGGATARQPDLLGRPRRALGLKRSACRSDCHDGAMVRLPPKLTLSRRVTTPRPADETNSVVRALALYRTRLAQRDGGSLAVPRFRAHLAKTLPIDAGLGGAASNAAAALVGANEP